MRIQEKFREDDVLIRVVGVNDEEGKYPSVEDFF